MSSRETSSPAALALALLLLAPLALAAPLPTACTPGLDEAPGAACAPIRPGAIVLTPSGQCTLNFVVTDGTELYIGTAGHCVQHGHRVRLPEKPSFGTVVHDGLLGDWAFIRIDAEDRPLVDPTLSRWGGPEGVRAPSRGGEPILHYGHGASLGQHEATRGRAGAVYVAGDREFSFLGSVDRGDSGSPVLLASGEAAGIAVRTFFVVLDPASAPVPLSFATRFDRAMEDFENALGTPVTLVDGSTLGSV